MTPARVFSGMQPSADSLHLGNYLGALRQWVALQDTYEAFYCIVDLHALDVAPDPEVLRRRSRITAAQYLAAGVDPERSTLFVQSHAPEHAQLAWVLGCLTGHGEASRMTQFKDKSARHERVSVALFTYPVLQAADILLYSADRVPVGEDQRQHLELSRDLAERFNSRFGDTFVAPQPHIVEDGARILDLQAPERKMSGSIGGPGTLFLQDDPAVNAKKIRSAVTDTGREVAFDPERKPGVSNLLTVLSVLSERPVPQLELDFAGRGYGDLKKELAEAFVDWVTPLRERTQAYLDDPHVLDEVLREGARRARAVAGPKLAEVYDKVGLLPSGASP